MGLTKSEAQRIRRLLDRWGSTLHFVRNKEREIAWARERIEAAYDAIGGTSMGSAAKLSGKRTSSVERAIVSVGERIEVYEELSRCCYDKIAKAMALKSAIDAIVDELDVETQDILRMRYVDRHQWDFIAIKMVCDERNARRKEYSAIEKLSENVRLHVV